MKITYKVSDGYVNNGPHTVHVPDSELAYCESWEEAETVINDAIQNDFEQKVSWCCEVSKYRSEVEALIKDREGEDRAASECPKDDLP